MGTALDKLALILTLLERLISDGSRAASHVYSSSLRAIAKAIVSRSESFYLTYTTLVLRHLMHVTVDLAFCSEHIAGTAKGSSTT